MTESKGLPKIEVRFEDDNSLVHNYYQNLVPITLEKMLPKDIFKEPVTDPESREEQRKRLHEELPLFKTSIPTEFPSSISFFLLCDSRRNAFKFFYEMLSCWLIPGERIEVVLFYATDFLIPSYSEDHLYTLCETILRVESEEEYQIIQKNLPTISSEIKLGVSSAYYARKILEIKGFTADEKTAMIQEYITYLVKRLPHQFDNDVITEMQHVLVKCRDDFKAVRESRHMSRIISVHYLFRRGIQEEIKKAPKKRQLKLKFLKTRLHLQEGHKHVLGICVGLNFLKDTEVFEERHLLKAIKNYLPQIESVENSFFVNMRGFDQICLLYLEIAKTDGSDFSMQEVSRLRQVLPNDLKDRIEHLMHPVFMPRNEEEVMRNILVLSKQIKYLKDIPQVIISFDEQSDNSLIFTIILLRIVRAGDLSIQEMFERERATMKYVHDRVRKVDMVRKRYPKEVSVFRVKLAKESFLRRDHSINLYKARRYVVEELTRVVGEFRDYNGGMISKQNELLSQVRGLLVDNAKYNELMLENFFYSLTPVIMRSVLEPFPLKELFLMMIEALDASLFSRGEGQLCVKKYPDFVLATITADEVKVNQDIAQDLKVLEIASTNLATAHINVYERSYVGYIYRSSSSEKQDDFIKVLEDGTNALLQNQEPALV
jgi:hypothetical protein